ncbi:MAG: hypothetical protein JNM61_09435 [Zoogloeaceae bacterium]|nr:hypothetical protein [Zoogloeaceae bacterium]
MTEQVHGRTTAPSQSITRQTASEINPLISSLWTEDTLDGLARMVLTLGYLLSEVENPGESSDPSFGNLYLLFGPIAAALRIEASAPCLATPGTVVDAPETAPAPLSRTSQEVRS